MNLSLPGDFRHAMAKDSTYYAIDGVEVRKAGDERVLVAATDGHVLSMRLQDGSGPDAPMIIPGEVIPTLKGGGTVTQTGENELQLRQGNKKTLIGEVGVGTFPPCADLLPEITGVADLDVVRDNIDKALGIVDGIQAADLDSPEVDKLADSLKAAQTELRKSHVQKMGVSGLLLYNLARSVNAGGGWGNLGVTLIIPMNPAHPICVLPQGTHDAESLGVIMPVRVDGVDAGTWEKRRRKVLEAYKPAEEPVQADEVAETDPDGVEAPAAG